MNQRIINCPHCCEILPEEVWTGKSQGNKVAIRCPNCGVFKMWKGGKWYTPSVVKQRYLC